MIDDLKYETIAEIVKFDDGGYHLLFSQPNLTWQTYYFLECYISAMKKALEQQILTDFQKLTGSNVGERND